MKDKTTRNHEIEVEQKFEKCMEIECRKTITT